MLFSHRSLTAVVAMLVLPFLVESSDQILASAEEYQQTFHLGNETHPQRGCEEACTALKYRLDLSRRFSPGEEKVYFEEAGTALPDVLFSEFFSARQGDVRPRCLAIPTSAEDVSEIMKVISLYECKFAAKSGGHSMFPGAASAPDGISIDLKLLNGLGLSEYKETVFVGTGNRWTNVYGFLDQWNLTAVGGRAGFVGVGGFLLGGGLSYISRKYGWGADNVRNFEVVLANGSISQINHKTHPDLYWALRGGGSNFGIVTRFDLETHPQGPVWGDFNSMFVSDVSARASALGISRLPTTTIINYLYIKALTVATNAACVFGYCTDLDTYAGSMWRTLEASKDDPYLQVYGFLCMGWIGDIIGFHMTDVKGREDVPAYREVKAGKKIVSEPMKTNMTWHADNLSWRSGNGGGRSSFSTLTLKNPSKEIIAKLIDLFIEEFGPTRGMRDIIVSLPLMFITADEVIHMSKNGGNPLGLKVEDCPLLLINAAADWENKAFDEFVLEASKRFVRRATEMGKEMGVYHEYKYMNYASLEQDVFAGYGVENRRKLREIQRKYDVKDVFHRLQDGYFKV